MFTGFWGFFFFPSPFWKYMHVLSRGCLWERKFQSWHRTGFWVCTGACGASSLCFYARILKINDKSLLFLANYVRKKKKSANLFFPSINLIFNYFLVACWAIIWFFCALPVQTRWKPLSKLIISMMVLLIVDIWYYIIVASHEVPVKKRSHV